MTDRLPTERWFEEFRPGEVFHSEPLTVTEAEIIAFARQFDPQPMHLDPEAARAGEFGGLIASGWHTASLAMRLLCQCYISRVAGLVSPGIDELRWLRPVRPGDTLRLEVEVTETVPSRSRPDRGLVRTSLTLRNAADEPVLTMRSASFLRRRPPEAAA